MCEEEKAFEKCKKEIKRLLIEEKQCKAKFEKIQKDKLECIRLLLDEDYCKKMETNNEKRNY